MPQLNDCGCPKIVTPSIDDLLAIKSGSYKPIRIRDRKPPPAKVSAGLKGWMEWRLVDRKGREVKGGEGPNLILDQGLDQIATIAVIRELGGESVSGDTYFTHFSIIRYCAVGTDNTAPATSDTGLGTEIARTDTYYQADKLTRPSDGVYEITRYMEFDFDEANGNLTEWGFSNTSSVGSNLFNRALFLDGVGSPEVVTKTDEYKLRIIYTLQVTVTPVTMTAGSFDITGVGTINGNYSLIGRTAPSGDTSISSMRCIAPDLKIWGGWARGAMGAISGIGQIPTQGKAAAWPDDLSALTYTYNSTFNLNSAFKYSAYENFEARDAYVAGSFQRTGGLWKFGTTEANLTPIKAFLGVGARESFDSGLNSCGPYAGYIFDLDLADEFNKDNEHTLTLGVPTVTWGRAP